MWEKGLGRRQKAQMATAAPWPLLQAETKVLSKPQRDKFHQTPHSP